ncbi:MAG: NADH-quinone oxidoreductase subunit L [Rhodospirillaceae bacterium]
MEILAVFPPLLASIVAGFFGRWIGDRGAQLVTVAGVVIAALASTVLFNDVALHGHSYTIELFTWIKSGSFVAPWALRFDTLTVVMLIVVTFVSSCVHIYSIGYMSHDPHKPRFQAYLSLFTFAMLMLVTADNFVQMFFGWEGVGLMSYLLIGFWYERPTANDAAIKAFVQNRVGDFGFALGIFAVFDLFHSVDFGTVFHAVPAMAGEQIHFLGADFNAITICCLLLFMGAWAKSAQFGLHTWLLDAMEGPTPVSALIHAATMVTAGVFMVARLSPLFEFSPVASGVVTVFGATTAFVAASIAITQFDIKRIIAYSTMSQLGYMMFACGVSAYNAAIFHLMTHGFFKALLFLGAGSVIHAMSGEQDLRKMGGLWKLIPVTYVLLWVGNLALAGIPLFSGYFSKDSILEAAYAAGTPVGMYAYWLGIITAFLTAFYSWRLLFLAFHGKSRADHHTLEHVHESPLVMLLPCAFLAIGAICAGALAYTWFIGDGAVGFWRDALLILPNHDTVAASHHGAVPEWAEVLPTVVAVGGIFFAFLFYMVWTGLPRFFTLGFKPVHTFLYNHWYVDNLYDWLIVQPLLVLGRLCWKTGDGTVIDGLGPEGVAAATRFFGQRASRLQSGYVFHYAFAMVIGVVVLVTWFYLYG